MTYIFSSYDYNNTYCLSNYYSGPILQQQLYLNDIYSMTYIHSTYVTMSYTVATTLMPLRPYITAITMSL